MTGNYLAVAINQDRDIETERAYAVADLLDLPLAVAPRVGGVGFQLVDPMINNR